MHTDIYLKNVFGSLYFYHALLLGPRLFKSRLKFSLRHSPDSYTSNMSRGYDVGYLKLSLRKIQKIFPNDLFIRFEIFRQKCCLLPIF